MHRVLKDGGACLCFCAWNKIDIFMAAWKKAGFRVVGHVVFPKKAAFSALTLSCHAHRNYYSHRSGWAGQNAARHSVSPGAPPYRFLMPKNQSDERRMIAALSWHLPLSV